MTTSKVCVRSADRWQFGHLVRSLLFVPGDSESKMAKALGSGADALILDLEDAVAASGKDVARQRVGEFLGHCQGMTARPRLYVRINGLETDLARTDLDSIIPHHPDGVVLPKADGGPDIAALAELLADLERATGRDVGSTGILPIPTETARGLLRIATIPGSSNRLLGLTWGGEDLAADIGAEKNRDATGSYTAPYAYARLMTLLTAAAAEVDAIDSVYTAFRDNDGLQAECEVARRDGFAGKLAIHPAQVPIINEAFTPSSEALSEAHEIVAAFETAISSGVAAIRGKMVDQPHLRQAQRTIARAALVRPV